MSAMKRFLEDYELAEGDPDIAFETALDTELAIREWATHLDETGRRYQ